MADGVPITAGSGTTIATDDAGASGHVQIVKLARSADGSATAVTADANGLQVQLGAALPAGTNNIGRVVVVNGFDSTDNVFVASVVASAAGASKNHLSLYNADATVKIDVLQAYLTRETTAAVTGLVRGHRLFRFTTAHTGGSLVTPLQLDTTQSPALDSDVTARAGSTIGGAEATPLGAVGVYEEETGGGVAKYVLWDWRETNRPVTLNQNQGVTIQQDSTAGTGLVSAVIVFRQR